MDSAKKFHRGFPYTEKATVKKQKQPLRCFTSSEEWIHSATHGLSALTAVFATVILVLKAAPLGGIHTLGAMLFGISLVILYSASATYHASCAMFPADVKSRVRDITQKFDHCSIFILIVGTYIPACFTSLGGAVGWTVFGIVGSCCTVGFILNAISVARFQGISLWLYIITGWTIATASVPFYNEIGSAGFALLLAGGIFYTVGVIFYRLQNIKYMHIIWHALVILGSVMHYLMVYFYCY